MTAEEQAQLAQRIKSGVTELNALMAEASLDGIFVELEALDVTQFGDKAQASELIVKVWRKL